MRSAITQSVEALALFLVPRPEYVTDERIWEGVVNLAAEKRQVEVVGLCLCPPQAFVCSSIGVCSEEPVISEKPSICEELAIFVSSESPRRRS